MKRNVSVGSWMILAASLSLLLVAITFAWSMGLFEPRITRLVRQLQTSKRPEDRAAAARKLGQMGAEARPAAPALVAALGDMGRYLTSSLLIIPNEHRVCSDAYVALKQIGGPETVEALADELVASSGKGKGGPSRDSGHEPHLAHSGNANIETMGNADYRSRLAQLLADMGSESLPAAERLLVAIDGCNHGGIVTPSVTALESMKLSPGTPAADKALQVLPQFCMYSGGTGRTAATILYGLAPDDQKVLEIYVRSLLYNSSPGGPSKLPMNDRTIPLVIRNLNEPQMGEPFRESAVVRLGTADLSLVLEALRAALASREPRIRAGAAAAFAFRGPEGAVVEPELTALLTDADAAVRVAAATAVWRCLHRPEAALPVLVAVLETEKSPTRDAAQRFLDQRGGDDAWAAPALVNLALAGHEKRLRLAALGILAKFGAAVGEQSPALLECLKDEDADVQRAAVKVMAAIEKR